MDGHLDNNEFEIFIREKADQHRLYPNDKAWDNIHSRLHTRKRWMAGAMLLLFISAGLVTWVMNESGESKAVATINTNKTIAPKQITKAKNKIQLNKQRNVLYSFLNTVDANKSSDIGESVAEESTPIESVTSESTLTADANSGLNSENLQTDADKDQVNTEAKANSTGVLIEKKLSGITNDKKNNTVNLITSGLISSLKKNDFSQSVTAKESNSLKQNLNSTNSRSRETAGNKKIRKNNFQFYITPGISYRALKEDVQFIVSARANMSLAVAPTMNTTDISKVVKHKPDLGIQIGFLNRAPVSKSLSVLMGLQFNVNKYDIKAYSYPSEVATIAYSNLYGYPSSISTITTYRSTGGYSSNWLRNYYLSASAPIGLEYKLTGSKKNYWGIAATAQPTYVLGNRAYVISTDYQNYAQVPYLIRKWNVNLGFETFAQFKAGKTTMKIGPQFRYQTLSSFKKGYPVEEHLFDFGVKMGVILGK